MRNKHEQQWRTLKNLLWAINQTWNGAWQLQRQVTGITLLDWNNKIISNVTDFLVVR